jgi:hypothetical protein
MSALEKYIAVNWIFNIITTSTQNYLYALAFNKTVPWNSLIFSPIQTSLISGLKNPLLISKTVNIAKGTSKQLQ